MTNKLLFFLCLVFVFLYAAFIFNPIWADNIIAYSLLTVAEIITFLYLFGMLWTSMYTNVPTLSAEGVKWKQMIMKRKLKKKIAVLVPTYNESPQLVEETLKAVISMKGFSFETYLLDDAQNPKMRFLAKQLKVRYVIRDNHNFAKSGNLLNAIKKLSHIEYIVIFDSDFKPEPNFLIETIPFMSDSDIAMVQTPQRYRNESDNFIARGSSKIQEFFYTHVMSGKNAFNAAFCVGTNMVFRKTALDQIGGYALRSHSEDIWTSRLLHEAGWKTVFLPQTLAYGLAPTTLEAFFNRQYRWCKGGMGMFFYNNSLFSKGLTFDQKMQYFLSNVYYLTGLAILIHLTLPILYLMFDIKAVRTDIDPILWVSRYVPYLMVTLAIFISATKSSYLHAATVSLSIFPIYINALLSALLKRDLKWKTTNSSRNKIITELLFPHFFFLGLSVASVFVGLVTIGAYNTGTTITAMIWASINIFFLTSFIVSAYGIHFVFEIPVINRTISFGMEDLT